MMSNQAIFDRVWQCFVVEKKPKSRDIWGQCLYSHKLNGAGCAVGCCLPADDARRWDNLNGGGSVRHIATARPDEYGKHFDTESLGLLSDLQYIHDQMPDGFMDRQGMLNIAQKHHLLVPEEAANG